jgi:hypothetical protein
MREIIRALLTRICATEQIFALNACYQEESMTTNEERISKIENSLHTYKIAALVAITVAVPFLVYLTLIDTPEKINTAVVAKINETAGLNVKEKAKELDANVEKSKTLLAGLQRVFAIEVTREELEKGSGQSGCVRESPTHVSACARRYCISRSTDKRRFIGGALQEMNATTGGITILCLMGEELK